MFGPENINNPIISSDVSFDTIYTLVKNRDKKQLTQIFENEQFSTQDDFSCHYGHKIGSFF